MNLRKLYSRWTSFTSRAAARLFRILLFASCCSIAVAQEPDSPPPTSPPVAAIVTFPANEKTPAQSKTILLAEVQRLARRAPGIGRVDSQKRLADALDQVINLRLAAEQLRRQGFFPDDSQLDARLEQLRAETEQQQTSWNDYLRSRGLTEQQLRDQLSWEFAWRTYLEKNLTEAAAKEYFEKHHRDYDGTRLRVSHILWKIDSQADPRGTEALTAQAKKVREEILSGKLTFPDAARQYSSGPSRLEGGDLGWIERHDKMHENFARAAFALHQGEISPPIVTPFGINLILCTEIESGELSFDDVRPQLEKALAARMFLDLADIARKTAKIEFTGASPYHDPQTGKLLDTPSPSSTQSAPRPAR